MLLENKYIAGNVDEKYVTSTLRQHMLASGCIIKEKPEEATYVVEVRAGAVGTNRSRLAVRRAADQLAAGWHVPAGSVEHS